ncbi:MAG: hypothetical protein HDR01_00665 [Lachnospiraceae bacterium]|nr:hypothetical protein [Lachnospiraceae bacterium]
MRLWKIRCIRLILCIFRIFPVVNNRIVFVCNYGKSYACNPKYVFKALREKYGEKLQYVWVLNEKHPELEGQAVQVKNKSMAFFYYMLTARVIVGNNALGSYLPKRSSQCFINTWHGGGAYKKVHFDVAVSDTDRKIYEIFARQTDCHLSSSKLFTECMAVSTKVPKERFLEVGMPRNDCLLQSLLQNGETGSEESAGDRSLILKRLGVKEELWQKKILLYAPTFRGETNHGYFENSMDIPAVLESLEKRFSGEWILLFRGHPKMLRIEMEQCVCVTGYEDMQEILLCADALITDFSSVMWDYMFLQRPGFLYIPDLEELEKEDRFYTKVKDWPFEYARSNHQLCEIIEHYEKQKAMDKIEAHKRLLGNVETGQACEKVSDYIYKKVCS